VNIRDARLTWFRLAMTHSALVFDLVERVRGKLP
jgi:hypothetical protein